MLIHKSTYLTKLIVRTDCKTDFLSMFSHVFQHLDYTLQVEKKKQTIL